MFCSNCGHENQEGNQFCQNCGQTLSNSANATNNNQNVGGNGAGININLSMPNQNFDDIAKLPKSIKDLLIDPTENVIAQFGHDYLANIILKNKCEMSALILTDKRLYFRGKSYSASDSKNLSVMVGEKILDLEDITASKFVYGSKSPVALILVAILLFIASFPINGIFRYTFPFIFPLLIIVSIVLVIMAFCKYMFSRCSYFVVEYAGGVIDINCKLYGVDVAREFNKKIRIAKDKLVGKK